MKHVLVAYASKCGSIAEIAQAVGVKLAENGYRVDIQPVQKIKSLDGYDALVMGTALRMSKPIGEMDRFVRKFGARMQKLPAALFSVGMAMKTDTPETRATTLGFLKTTLEKLPPLRATGLFGGKLDCRTLSPFLRWAFARDTSGDMAEGDWRDWDAIRAWAGQLAF